LVIEQSEKPNPVASEQPSAQEPRSFRRHRQRPPESGFRRFVRRFTFEIAWFLVVILGVVLVVVDPGSIKTTLWRWAKSLAGGLLAAADGFFGLTAHFGLADMIGGLLILLAIAALLIRIRWQLMHAPSLTTSNCPDCGGEMHRVHRHAFDRWISLYVPVYRYRCSNRECEWAGLRVVSSGTSKRRS
jgi:hypothetical protein